MLQIYSPVYFSRWTISQPRLTSYHGPTEHACISSILGPCSSLKSIPVYIAVQRVKRLKRPYTRPYNVQTLDSLQGRIRPGKSLQPIVGPFTHGPHKRPGKGHTQGHRTMKPGPGKSPRNVQGIRHSKQSHTRPHKARKAPTKSNPMQLSWNYQKPVYKAHKAD